MAVTVIASIAILAGTVSASEGVSAAASGGGHFLFSGTLDVQFGFSAVAKADGSAQGSFHQSYTLDGLTTSYWGTVTCLSVDTVNHRAWIGGVLTKVESDDPGARLVGEDVWFRVLDNGQGQDTADRSTVSTPVKPESSNTSLTAGESAAKAAPPPAAFNFFADERNTRSPALLT